MEDNAREIELSIERKASPELVKSVEIPQTTSAVPVTKSKKKPSNTVKERLVRMTIDTPEGMHRKLKIPFMICYWVKQQPNKQLLKQSAVLMY